MSWPVPEPLKAEHDELHATLSAAIQAPGRVGEAAQAVARLLHPHFVKEEAYALPPLGALPALARGEPVPEAAEIIAMADRLQTELPAMVQEHQAIIAALDDFASAARDANRPEYVQFAEKLVLHARTEEEVLYPAAILVGRYLARKAEPTG